MLDINKLKYYGQWDSEFEREYENWWWYSTYDQKIYNVDELMEKFSFENYEDIENSFDYIPLWKTDESQLIRDFIVDELKDKSFERVFLEPPKESFNHYVTSNQNHITRWWYEYYDSKLVEDAINWCKENRIPYKK